MQVVILAGGKGTRLSEETGTRPKPMVEIGGLPILEHIMRYYHSFGHREFVIACGHLGNVIKDYFVNYQRRNSDLTIRTATGDIDLHGSVAPDWTVTLVDTGPDTMTGGRLKLLKPYLKDRTFMMTYGDGLANVDLDSLLEIHRNARTTATVTAVRPPARFGSLAISGGRVIAFEEKIDSSEARINGGYFVLEPGVFDLLGDPGMPFEREPLEILASTGQLACHVHDGFWQPMDTLRDKLELDEMCSTGKAPWMRA